MIQHNITFKHTNSDTDSRIHNFVRQKLAILDKYLNDESAVRIEVEFEKVVAHKSGPICRVEVNVWKAGKLYRAEATEMTFEAAVDVVKDYIDQELKRSSERQTSLLRRGSRKIKEFMQFGR